MSIAIVVPGQLIFTEPQAAQLLAMSPRKLHTLQRRGIVKSFKDGGLRRYHRGDLEAYAEQLRSAS